MTKPTIVDDDENTRNGSRVLSVSVQRALGAFTLDVTFAAPRGIVALVGPSGSGKTVTLRAIAGLLRPQRGRIVAGDTVLFDSTTGVDVPARERRLSYVFQQYALFPHLTVVQNVRYGLHASSRQHQTERAAEMLEMVGLASFADRLPNTLSGGQQQRVALARAIAPRPQVVLLDEPLAALDTPLRQRLGAELRALHERSGIAMVLVTHDPTEAARIADNIVRIDDGRVIAD